jgi:hypothetical protein
MTAIGAASGSSEENRLVEVDYPLSGRDVVGLALSGDYRHVRFLSVDVIG